jgi:ADP-heptose:LPS heptosyltransferase
LWVNDRARVSAEAKLSELGMSRGERYVAVHPFGSTARQRWPLTNIEVLGRELREHGMRLVVLGGPEFKLLLPTSNRSGLINTVGKLTIPELLAVIDRAAAVVSTDSGPFHIAGALGRPLVGLFRSSRPEHARRYPQARVILGRSAGCEGRCRWDYCRSAPCRQLEAIGVNEVMAMLEQALSSDQPAISV